MGKITFFFCLLLGAAFLIVYSGVIAFPKNAKLCGDYWVSCVGVKQGMYHCKIYSKHGKKLLSQKTYIYPFFYRTLDDVDLSSRVTQYDGDTIYFDGNRKLIACDIPEDAVRVQCINDGAWVSCKQINRKENLYTCTVYSVKDGSVMSRGNYVLKKYHWDVKARKTKYSGVKEHVQWLEMQYYGGVAISLQDNMVLMPYGWIEYPEGPRSGLRVQYNAEGKVLSEEEYG